jgi:hypothetical protein
VQGLQAIQDHELGDNVGSIFGEPFEKVKAALKWTLEL